MRRVAYALTASVALVFGALTPASAGCYGECNGYQESYRSGPSSYERYSDRPYSAIVRTPIAHATKARAIRVARATPEARAITRPTTSAAKNIRSAVTASGRPIAPAPTTTATAAATDRPAATAITTVRIPATAATVTAATATAVTAAVMATVVATVTEAMAADTATARLWQRLWLRQRLGNRGYGYGSVSALRRRLVADRPGYGYGYGASYAGGYGGCHTAYIPYGWTWYRGTSC